MDFYRLSLYWIVYDIVNSVTSPHEHFSLRKSACNKWFMRTMKKRRKKPLLEWFVFFCFKSRCTPMNEPFFFGCNKLKHSNEVFGQVFAAFNFNYVFKTRCNENVLKRSGKKAEREYLNIYHWNWMLLMYLYSLELLQQCALNEDKNRSMYGNHVFGTVVGYICNQKSYPVYICYFWKSLNPTHV